jgi:hypothetical protein
MPPPYNDNNPEDPNDGGVSIPTPIGSPYVPSAPAPGTSSGFGTTFKPWESIDTTVSQDQWQAWEGFRDPNCPADKPYKSERGAAGCFEKPVDCPPGQIPGGPGTSPCRPLRPGEQTGGGPGGSGGPGGGGAGAPMSPALNDFGMNSKIAEQIQQLFAGGSRFSPKVMGDITGQNKLDEQSRIARETQALQQSQAARGVISSPFAAAQEARTISAAGSEFDAGQRELRIQKAATDFTDKLAALKTAQDWLNSLRSYALGMDSNNVQREAILANLTLGREKIQSEMDILLATIAGNKDLLGMQLDSNEATTLQRMLMCLQNPALC